MLWVSPEFQPPAETMATATTTTTNKGGSGDGDGSGDGASTFPPYLPPGQAVYPVVRKARKGPKNSCVPRGEESEKRT